jgi:hypothetical protein
MIHLLNSPNGKAKVLFAFVIPLLFSGCASLAREAPIDWFVRVANEPDMTNFRFCVSSASETDDGINPVQKSGAHMTCGDSLESVKKRTVSTCERVQKTKCMPVYYFERGKDEFVKDFEQENMARKTAESRRIQMQAQKAEEERLSAICIKYGFRSNTPAHANCVMQQSQHEQAMTIQQERLDAERRIKAQQDWDRSMEGLRRASEMLKNDGSTPGQTICRPNSSGALICR